MANRSTRSAKGGGTIRKRPDGRWEARYSLGFDPKTGKQVQKSVYGKTQKEVRQRLSAITTEIDSGTYCEPAHMKLSEWLEEWLKDYIGNVKPATAESYRTQVHTHIIPSIGTVELSKLTTPMIQHMYNELQREKELSAKTVKNVHGVLHRALDQAQKMGLIRNNPTEAVTLPRMEKKQIKPMEDEELTAFQNAIKGNPFELVFFVTVFTGLREGEVLGLTWDCVDFDRGTLFINKQHSKVRGSKEYTFSSLKNDCPRLIEAAPTVMNVIRQQRERQQLWQRTMGDLWNNTENLVFTTETGRYLCNFSVYKAFKKVVRELGLDAVRFHDLRHTFAVNSLKAGDDIKTVQGNLGHHTASFTLDVYGHVTAGMRHASASRMDQYIQSITNA